MKFSKIQIIAIMEIQIEKKKGGYFRGFEVKESYFRYPKNKKLEKLSCHDIKYVFISGYLCDNEVASEILDDYRKMFYLNDIYGREISSSCK